MNGEPSPDIHSHMGVNILNILTLGHSFGSHYIPISEYGCKIINDKASKITMFVLHDTIFNFAQSLPNNHNIDI